MVAPGTWMMSSLASQMVERYLGESEREKERGKRERERRKGEMERS